MITHFTKKAFLVTYEQASGGFGCIRYVLAGIRNKRSAAEILLKQVRDKHAKDFRPISSLKIQEVELDVEATIFNFNY